MFAHIMKQPRIPSLIVDVIQNALLSCDGVIFDTREACPVCGGKLSGYDTKKKQFAVMLEGDDRHPVHVLVKRFSCRQCNAVCFADEPFYPDTRIGSPVVDLCRTLTGGISLYRATAFIRHLGIMVERGTVRNYAQGSYPEIPTTELYGLRLPLSVISLSELTARSGEGSRIPGTEVLAACGFPSAYRAAPDRRATPEQGDERDKEKDKEKRQAQ
jgi:hypothetical protein